MFLEWVRYKLAVVGVKNEVRSGAFFNNNLKGIASSADLKTRLRDNRAVDKWVVAVDLANKRAVFGYGEEAGEFLPGSLLKLVGMQVLGSRGCKIGDDERELILRQSDNKVWETVVRRCTNGDTRALYRAAGLNIEDCLLKDYHVCSKPSFVSYMRSTANWDSDILNCLKLDMDEFGKNTFGLNRLLKTVCPDLLAYFKLGLARTELGLHASFVMRLQERAMAIVGGSYSVNPAESMRFMLLSCAGLAKIEV